MTESSLMKFPARLDIRRADQVDELSEPYLQPVAVDPEGRDAGLEAGDLAVVVGTEDVDHPVELADEELVTVVGEIAGQVGEHRRCS